MSKLIEVGHAVVFVVAAFTIVFVSWRHVANFYNGGCP